MSSSIFPHSSAKVMLC